jgi:serine protease Do
MRVLVRSVLLPFGAGLAGAAVYINFMVANPVIPFQEGAYQTDPPVAYSLPVHETRWQPAAAPAPDGPSFIEAARRSTPSVVFIKAQSGDEYAPTSYFDLLFGRRSGPMASSGSGVIYAADGYIITNNHVVEGAKTVEVVHQRRTYKAAVVGTDAATDLAVLKVEASGLPAIALGRSQAVQVGEWALAVGNPFNLTSTVTAGIVSAKGREISFGKGLFPLESFIQTDAAINPGNSGGALVNMRGELIGINTAILSQTGSYAGYGFAVPVDVVRKVAEDLIQYGEVQKAFVGAEVIDLDLNKANELNVKADRGVVVSHVAPDGAAARAGLKTGDVITQVNAIAVESRGHFDEIISYYSPGDKVTLSYIRRNQPQQGALTLTNREGNTSVLRREVFTSQTLGADLEKISKVERDVLNIDHGVRVTNIRRGFMRRLGLQEGFVITSINDTPIDDPEKLVQELSRLKGRVIIEGVNTKGVKGYYQYYF